MSKKCTLLWREAHFRVKMFKALHVRTTFGCSDVVRAAGARDCATCQKWAKCEGFLACPKTMAGVGHLWIRPAIRDSQQPTSPIGFLFFWNFRHRLVRHYWYPTIIYQTLDGHVGTLSCCCKRRYILTRKNMLASHPRLAVISQYISIRQHIQRPLYIWLPTIPHEISTLFHLILAILLGVFTCVFYLLVSYWLCVLHVPISGRRKNTLNSYLDCFSLSPVRPMLLSWIISCMYFPWFYDFIHKLQKKRRKLSGVAMTPLAPAAAAGTSLGWLGKLLNQLGWI